MKKEFFWFGIVGFATNFGISAMNVFLVNKVLSLCIDFLILFPFPYAVSWTYISLRSLTSDLTRSLAFTPVGNKVMTLCLYVSAFSEQQVPSPIQDDPKLIASCVLMGGNILTVVVLRPYDKAWENLTAIAAFSVGTIWQ
jgi:hypothetical protein